MIESTNAAGAVQTISADSRAQRAANMVWTRVDDESVVLNIETGYYLQLNAVATRIWEFLETPTRLSTLCERLLETFAVSPQACREDVHEFLLQLQSNGVLEITQATE